MRCGRRMCSSFSLYALWTGDIMRCLVEMMSIAISCIQDLRTQLVPSLRNTLLSPPTGIKFAVPCRGTHRTHASCWLVPSLMRNLIFVQRRDLRTKHNCDLRKRGEAETSFPTERRALDLFAPRPRQSASSVAHQMDPNCSKDSPKTCTRQHRPNAAAEPHPRSSLTPRRPQDRTQPWCLTLVIPRGCSPRRRSSCS